MRKSSKCLSDCFSLQIDWAKSCCETSCSVDVIDSFHTFAKMVEMIVHSVLRDKRNDDAPSFFSIANKATATSELLYHFEDSIRENILLESRSQVASNVSFWKNLPRICAYSCGALPCLCFATAKQIHLLLQNGENATPFGVLASKDLA